MVKKSNPMKTIKDLITISKKYDTAFDERNKRFTEWQQTKFTIVKDTLTTICNELTENVDFYKSNLFVEGHVNLPLDGVGIRSGVQKIDINRNGENGFYIQFTPIDNGKIAIVTYPHSIGKGEQSSKFVDLIEPKNLNAQEVVNLVYKALEQVQKTSLLFAQMD